MFVVYTALRCPDKESRVRLTYAFLIIREAQRHGGQGWLAYDRIFSPAGSTGPFTPVERFISGNSGLHTFLDSPYTSQGPSVRASTFCSPCHEVDHTTASCALGYLHCPNSAPTLQPTRPGRKRLAVAAHSLCISWNQGRCLYPSSYSFGNVCFQCFQHHPVVDCLSMNSRGPSHLPSSAGSSFRHNFGVLHSLYYPSTLPIFPPSPRCNRRRCYPRCVVISCISRIAFGVRSMGYSSRCGCVGKEQAGAGANPSGRKGGVKCVMVFAISSKVLTLSNCSADNILICIHTSNNVGLT